MANTSPAYSVGSIATSQFSSPILFNDLNSNDRSFTKTLIRKYGTENYMLVQMALGNTVDYDKTDNHTFYHYEKRQLHSSFSVLADVTSATPGAAVTVKVGAADFYSSGTKQPARIGEKVLLDSSNIQGVITNVVVNGTSDVSVTIKPVQSADTFASAVGGKVAAGDLVLFRGATMVGEGSTKLTSQAPIWDKITNTITEHRDDFTITDIASMEKQEIMLIDGKPYYYDVAVDDVNKRYMNDMFWQVMEGVAATNTGLTAGTGGGVTNGSVGVIPKVQTSGSTIQYSASALGISDWQALARQLNFFGSPGEYHLLLDFYSKQNIDNFLFTTYKNTYGAATYESVGKSKEAAAAYGFDTFRMNNITFHMFTNPQFNTESIYKRSTTSSAYRNFGLAIPQRINQDPKMGESYPSFQIVFQKQPDGSRFNTFESGGFANQNKTTTMERVFTMISYYGVRTYAPNQYGIFQGV